MASIELDLNLFVTVEYQSLYYNHNTLPPTPTDIVDLKVLLNVNGKPVDITGAIPVKELDHIYDLCLKGQ